MVGWSRQKLLKEVAMGDYNDQERERPAAPDRVTVEPRQPQRRTSLARVLLNLILIFVAALILFVCVATVGVARQGQQFFDSVANLFSLPTPGPTATPQIDVGPIVLHRVRDLSELTTTQFGMQTVVTASRGRNLGPFQFNTRLLYVAYGEVRAGIDLSLLGPADVVVADDHTVSMLLPPPRILDSKIDVSRSYVYHFQQGLLSPEAPDLQTEAERQALDQIIAGACQTDILEQANHRAELAITELLGAMDFDQITVTTQMPDPARNPCAGVSQTGPPGLPLNDMATPVPSATPGG
jgi:hypothetical protein